MTTVPNNASFANYLLFRLTQARVKSKPIGWAAVYQTVIRVVLHLAGFGFLTWAGYQWTMIAGTVVAGFSCFVLSTLLTSGRNEAATAPADPMLRR